MLVLVNDTILIVVLILIVLLLLQNAKKNTPCIGDNSNAEALVPTIQKGTDVAITARRDENPLMRPPTKSESKGQEFSSGFFRSD